MQFSPATQESLWDIQVGKYFFLAGISILFYDHAITFSQEVEVIWKHKKTYISWLFIIVRYYCLLAMIVVSVGYFSTVMTRERCKHWMLFLPLGVTVPLSLMPSILMSIRVWAMYNGNRYLLGFMLLYLAAQTAAGLWQYTVPGGTPAPDPFDNYEYHFCIYLPPKSIGHASILYVSMELAFDSLTFLLTVSRTFFVHFYRGAECGLSRPSWSSGARSQRRSLLDSLVQDGALYFAAIFSINLTWVVMILHAPTGLRAIAAIPSACLMTTVICRITMNLRTTAYTPSHPTQSMATSGDIALARFYPAMVSGDRDDVRWQGNQRSAQGSFRSKVDGGYEEGPRPFGSGNGYGEYAYQHERVFTDV
ncbi:hypothetical protein BDY19DRAFT_538767 [Irpex rosettiformis]|uniref:Uncharacterized protein n=1 Tax=Irpex rosettiformis TaxID=378272 RepID=A0ACB8TR07_9APHY|nr:hypothetical protein BDY19DRAFT_538767 [Irpex rosettiformis]